MPNATAAATLLAFPNGRRQYLNGVALRATIAVAAGNYPANGIPLSFDVDGAVPAGVADGFAYGTAYSPSSGFVYQLDPVHQTLRVFVTGTAAGDPLNELASAVAVPAGVTGDTIYASADFNRSA